MGCGEAGGKVTPVQPSDVITTTIQGVNHSAFSEILNAELTPNVQIQFAYGINSDQVFTRANQSGSVTVTEGLGSISTGAAANSSCELLTNSNSKYRTGQGGVWRCAGLFTTGVAGSTQLLGIGTDEDGFFFGYNGADFGIMSRRAGVVEIRTLTVTTKSSDAENITITLNGTAKNDVAVTNGADTTVTANEIAAADYSDVGRGWNAYASGSKVVFVSWGAGARSGAYSLSGATSAVGTFAQTRAGAAGVDTWVTQANWNVDVMDGTGDSGITLDPTKGNVYQIQYQWLGFGMIKFFIENGTTGRFVNVHNIQYANQNTTLSVLNPALPCYVGAINTTNTSNITVKTGSMMAGVEGRKEQTGLNFGVDNRKTNTGATEIPILAIRNHIVYNNLLNRVDIKLTFISASVEHNKPVTVNFWANPTLVAASWSDVNTSSVAEYDTSATSFSGGRKLFSLSLGRTGNETIQLTDRLAGLLHPGDTLVATSIPASGADSETAVAFNWVEDF
jgi:ankyrin repeat protein